MIKRSWRSILYVLLFISLFIGVFFFISKGVRQPFAAGNNSALWGTSGELWNPAGRLPDFTYAGYHSGELAIPNNPIAASVTDFGANGGDLLDDTSAFQSAIDATTGVLSIPTGTYYISNVLSIKKNNLVLRGAGEGQTKLKITKSLTDVKGPSGAWTYSGGFIWFEGVDNTTKLADVTASASRASNNLTLSTTAGMSVNQYVRIVQKELSTSDRSLANLLHANQLDYNGYTIDALYTRSEIKNKIPNSTSANQLVVDYVAKITSISGNTITIDRPLRINIDTKWSPAIYQFSPSVQEVGIEDLTIDFPNSGVYAYHLEKGYNAISFETVANCWARRITIIDADSGIFLEPVRFCTVSDITLKTVNRTITSGPAPEDDGSGHHGVELNYVQDSLITQINFQTRFVHDFTVDTLSNGTVFSDSQGMDMNFDHHRAAPYENLFTNIDVGTGSRVWWSGGATNAGPHAGARATFWTVKSVNTPPEPRLLNSLWLQTNIVGSKRSGNTTATAEWIEYIDPTLIEPKNLHLAQLAYKSSPPPTPIPTQPPQWTVSDNGKFITAESSLYKVRFAYGGASEGWFQGSGTGGGGKDGAIVELYYKPTSTTRNLIFRNGTTGSGYDAMDVWEAENTAVDQASFNNPDFSTNRHGTVTAHSIVESAGRLFVDFTINFKDWQIIRHYILYPWGKITVASDLKVVTSGNWNYIGHRFNFAGSLYTFTNGVTYNWGSNYQADSDYYRAWTDGVSRTTGDPVTISPLNYERDQVVVNNYNQNTIAHGPCCNRPDTWSGFWLDSINSNDPDIIVVNGDKNDWVSPFSSVSRSIGSFLSYVEMAEYSFSFAPSNETQLGTTWFYMTTPSGQWSTRGLWPSSLTPWKEVFHVYLVSPTEYTTSDYVPLWRERANQLESEQPFGLSPGATVALDANDKLYHVTAAPASTSVSFQWKRASAHPSVRNINYRTAFVIQGLGESANVTVTDSNNVVQSSVLSYYNSVTDKLLVMLNFTQPSTPQTYTISATALSGATPTPTPITPPTPTPTPSASDFTLDFCVTTIQPWWQTTTGDVRMRQIVNPVPATQYASKPLSGSNRSVFFSSKSAANFSPGSASNICVPSHPKCLTVENEYGYNDTFSSARGLTSYSFYKFRANQAGLSINTTAVTSPFSGTLATGIYEVNGPLEITGYTHTPGAHVVLLVNGDVTIRSNIKVPKNANNLFILVARGNILVPGDLASGVGETSPSSTITNLEGIFSAEKSFVAQGDGCMSGVADRRLNIGGVVIANAKNPFTTGGMGIFSSQRSLCGADATNPSVQIQERYDFILQLTDLYKETDVKWKEVQP